MSNGGRRPLWRQPLLHFLVAGAAIFALNAARGVTESPNENRIVVTATQVERMAGLWQKTWGRPPSDTELQALVRDHIKEEVYYREALKLGLNVNDTVIRRRLRQKMEFLTTAASAAPDDATLLGYFEENVDRYKVRPVYDFEQMYFAGDDDDRLQDTLALLQSGSAVDNLGDRISLPREMSNAGETDIARTFGAGFYAALNGLDSGGWTGPVESGFGQHLVRINREIPARFPELDEVRRIVEDDWVAEQRAVWQESVFQEFRAGYTIDIEAADR